MPEDLSIQIDHQRKLWLMEISRQTFEDQGLDELESDSGLFLILEDVAARRFQVLAKAASQNAGRSMMELLAATLPPRQAA